MATLALPLPQQEVRHEGWLHKRPMDAALGLKQRRYVVLLQDALLWFKRDTAGTVASNWLGLGPQAVVHCRGDKLTLCSGGHQLTLIGASAGLLREWSESINEALGALRAVSLHASSVPAMVDGESPTGRRATWSAGKAPNPHELAAAALPASFARIDEARRERMSSELSKARALERKSAPARSASLPPGAAGRIAAQLEEEASVHEKWAARYSNSERHSGAEARAASAPAAGGDEGPVLPALGPHRIASEASDRIEDYSDDDETVDHALIFALGRRRQSTNWSDCD